MYRTNGEGFGEPVAQLLTREMLEPYEPNFTKKRVFEPYLVTLVEAWLRDMAYHWKSEIPPGWDALRGTGLLERIEEGTTQRLED